MRKTSGPGALPAFTDYDIDAPQVTAYLLGGGFLLAVLALALRRHSLQVSTSGLLGLFFLLFGLLLVSVALWMLWTCWRGKWIACGRLLDALRLRGKERLLDLGCGRGMLLLLAAQRLPRGKATGLDDWSQTYLFGNSRSKTLSNLQAAGLEKRAEVVTGDMRHMPFPKGRFDVVTAHLALHRVKEREGRLQVLREAARVLRKGGRLALQDFQYNRQTLEDLEKSGFQKAEVSGVQFCAFPPFRRITAVKK